MEVGGGSTVWMAGLTDPPPARILWRCDTSSQGGFTGMSWAPAAGVMKRDCCVLAPDLRGHGLTSSASTDTNTEHDTATNNDARNGGHGEHDHSEGDSDDSSRGEADALMSLESLAEDVASLLVEIFTRGLLMSPQRQRQGQQQPLHAASLPPETPASSISTSPSSSEGSNPTRGSTIAVGEDPPTRHVEEPNEERTDGTSTSNASHASGATASNSSSNNSPATSPEILAADPIKLLLVGHSLGGSIAVRVAGAAEELKRRCGGAAEVAGLVAVDVVEGTALASLDDMPEVSARRDTMATNAIDCAKHIWWFMLGT